MKQIKNSRYSCDALGNFYNPSGRKLKTYTTKKHSYPLIKININGQIKECNAIRIIYETFVGEVPNGYRVMRKFNKSLSLHNLKLVTLSEMGRLTGPLSRSKEVVLLGEYGEFIRKWKSARKCAQDMFCSYQTVMDICNGKRKKPFANLEWYE